MSITLSAVWLPWIATAFCVGMMLRPGNFGDLGFGAIFRVFWMIPVGFIWAAYFWAVAP